MLFFFPAGRNSWLPDKTKASNETSIRIARETKKIGIIGGGIAGATVAHSLAKTIEKQQNSSTEVEIIVFEGDSHGGGIDGFNHHRQNPEWIAATARNANSIVPAAAMHVLSRRSVLFEVLQDSLSEEMLLFKEKWFPVRNGKKQKRCVPRIDDFDHTPPYFALHPWCCIGPSATSEERWSFLRFAFHFLYNSLVRGNDAADERGRNLVQLARATRYALLKHSTFSLQDNYASQGFISLHRNLNSAEHAVQEAREHGEEAHLLDWEKAIQTNPRLNNLPMRPLFAVRRPNDHVVSCEQFIRHLIDESQDLYGVRYQTTKVDRVEKLQKNKERTQDTQIQRKQFRVHFQDGKDEELDMLVLAAGTQTVMFAAQLGVENYIPTYPLRGYSYTVVMQSRPEERLKQSFSVDSMYCSSVTPWMARWAGFGEFVGYRDKAQHVVPSIAPRVMARYAGKVFGDDAKNLTHKNALECYRPISPDDLPIAGKIGPGLFVHTGHGTLGWTIGLATAECVTQDIVDQLYDEASSTKNNRISFLLPDGTTMDRNLLSPERFTRM